MENKFQPFINLGMMESLLPAIPRDAKLSPGSTLSPESCGKQPGSYNPNTGEWCGMINWSSNVADINQINQWSTWPGDGVCLLVKFYPTIDNDIIDPVLAEVVNNAIDGFLGDGATRTRDNSHSKLYILQLAEGEIPQKKRRFKLRDGLGAVELLGDGQQAVMCGTHLSGGIQTFTGTPIVVTVEQLNILWDLIKSKLSDYIAEADNGGNSFTGERSTGEVVYVANDQVTIDAAEHYVNSLQAPAEGSRDDECYKIAAYVRQYYGISSEITIALMISWAEKCNPPFPVNEVSVKVNSVYRGAQGKQGEYNPDYMLQSAEFGVSPTPATASDVPIVSENVPEKTKKPAKKREYPPVSTTGIYPTNYPIPVNQFDPKHLTASGKPLSTLQNFKFMLQSYDIHVAYDQVGKRLLINGDDMIHESDIADNANWSQIVNLCKLNEMETGVVDHYIHSLMSEHEYNPVAEWFHEKPWDGVDRIEALFNTLILNPEQDRDMAWMTFRKWLAGACQIVQGQIKHFEFVLVLQDIQGGKGKTQWFKKLTKYQWRKDGMQLDPNDKDIVKQAVSYWLVELGELDSTFKKSEIKSLMSFLGHEFDEIRLPYAKTANKYKRRTAFMGSVNDEKFLIDDSGDRRFWPIAVVGVNYEHDIDMQQLWAQVDHLHERCWLNDEENIAVINHNKNFKAIDPLDERLEIYFSKTIPNSELRCLSITVILQQAGIAQPTKTQLNKAGRWLRLAGYSKGQGGGTRGYFVPLVQVF